MVFGEQVASKDGRVWLSGVRADLEALGYAVGAADLCAAGVGAPHIRQRLYWVGNAQRIGRERSGEPRATERATRQPDSGVADSRRSQRVGWDALPGSIGTVAEAQGRREGAPEDRYVIAGERAQPDVADDRTGSGMDHAKHDGADNGELPALTSSNGAHNGLPGAPGSWDSYRWVECADGKRRRIESGTIALVDGFPGRVERLRAYGNAIVPPLAAEFIAAFEETKGAA